MTYLSICCKMTPVGEEICSVAFGTYLCREVIQRVLWHEMVEIYVVDAYICIVTDIVDGHITSRILRDCCFTNELHCSISLMSDEVCGIVVLPVSLYGTVEGDALRNSIVSPQRRIGES